MRIRLKLKIIDNLINNSSYRFEKQIDNSDLELNEVRDTETSNEKSYYSFVSLNEEFDKIKYNKSDKINRLLTFYDNKSKKIMFPIDYKQIKFVSQLKIKLKQFLNLNYYNLDFLNESNQDNLFSYEINVKSLLIDNYHLCEDFLIKEVLKDNDKLV